MLPGYNHNIRYQEQMLHIQTEDSGLTNPHISSHIFVDGKVLATVRLNYQHVLDDDPGAAQMKVTELMQQQHQHIIRQLFNGCYDSQLRQAGCIGAPPSTPAHALAPPPSFKTSAAADPSPIIEASTLDGLSLGSPAFERNLEELVLYCSGLVEQPPRRQS